MAPQKRLPLPPLPNAEKHARAVAKLKAMTPAEFMETLVHAGTHTPDGKLTAEYVSEPESDDG